MNDDQFRSFGNEFENERGLLEEAPFA
jgi:hypothetical protein